MLSDMPWWYVLVFIGCFAAVMAFALPPAFWPWRQVVPAVLVVVSIFVLLVQGWLSIEWAYLCLGFAYTLYMLWISRKVRLNTPVYLGFLAAFGALAWVQAAGSWRFLSLVILILVMAQGWYSQADVRKMMQRSSAGPGD